MPTTAKKSCNILAELLVEHNIKNVVLSPGSRNAPLIIAVARNKKLKPTVIVDERCAAFSALGMCASSFGKYPVALICTSGSALLNYAPAIAEAYYRNLPLIVISADRPIEWIDQDDSQTIRQHDALSNFVKKSYDIPSNIDTENMQWYVNRSINDAILTSTSGRRGPVHINIQLDEPLNQISNMHLPSQRFIEMPKINRCMNLDFIKTKIYPSISNKKILIISGFQNCEPENWVPSSIEKENPFEGLLSKNNNIALLTESLSNINSQYNIYNIDRVLSSMSDIDKKALCPDIVITFGGALVSRFIKQYLREIKPTEHWHIGLTNTTIDCFKSLTMRIEMHPYEFFNQLNKLADLDHTQNIHHNSYRTKWLKIASNAEATHNKYIKDCSWSDLKAFSIMLPLLNGDLHLSNGTPIRYQQLFNSNKNIKSIYCNRGVSGIDGCTSTAIGHSLLSTKPTILISGDLSAQYDIGGLGITKIPTSFKMIVMCNGGGNIFRFISSTSNLPEVDEYFATKSNLPIEEISKGYGFKFFKATSEHELIEIMPKFICEKENPTILAIYTPEHESSKILKEYFNNQLNNTHHGSN